MKKQFKKVINLVLSFMILATTILGAAGVASATTVSLTPVKLSTLPAGSTVNFGGKTWTVLNPSTGYLLLQGFAATMAFDTNDVNTFNPSSSTNIAYYLNNSFYNSLYPEDAALIQSHAWTVGNQTNESSSTVTCNIGLMSNSEWENYSTYFNSSTGFLTNPSSWFWLRTPFSAYSYVVWSVTTGSTLNDVSANYPGGSVRPALYLSPDILVSGGNGGTVLGGKFEPPSITISSPSANQTFAADSTMNLAGTISDADGTSPYNMNVNYNIDGGSTVTEPNIADSPSSTPFSYNISLSGLAVGNHTLNVWASDSQGATSAGQNIPFTVNNNIAVTGISLTPSTLNLSVGGSTATLIAAITPANATNQTVTWSSDNTAVATVDNTGKITAVSAGTATITATTQDGNYTATCNVTVSQPITGVTLNKTTDAILAGGTDNLTATITPTNTTNQNVTWTSDNTAVATVDNSGKVTAVSAGTATITATTQDGSYTATCTVTVTNPVVVTSLTATPTTVDLQPGNTQQLAVTAHMSDNSTEDITATATYTSDNTDVATVNSSGLITAVGSGSANITIAYQGQTATVAISVNVPVTGVTVSPAVLDLTAGGSSGQLTATITPANATNQTITWTSSNTAVATVSSTGVVTPVAAGTATITATSADGSFTASCTVTVANPVVVNNITINPDPVSLNVAGTQQLSVTAHMSDNSTRDVTGTAAYVADNTGVATVDANGLVTAVASGTANITVTYQGQTATLPVTVVSSGTGDTNGTTNAIKAPYSISASISGNQQIIVTAYYSDGTNTDVTPTAAYQVADPTIASVSSAGVVSGLKNGTTSIIVTYGGKTATTLVTISNVSGNTSGTVVVSKTRDTGYDPRTIPTYQNVPVTQATRGTQTSVTINQTTRTESVPTVVSSQR